METLTEEGQETQKSINKQSKRKFAAGCEDLYKMEILEKRLVDNGNAVLLVVKSYHSDGSWAKTGNAFVVEDGKWKRTHRYASEDWYIGVIEVYEAE